MSIRTFIFCDGCNPQGIRNVYDNDHPDRRNSDGRNWYEGKPEDALKLGWKICNQGDILCPHCVENGMASMLIDHTRNSDEPKLNI